MKVCYLINQYPKFSHSFIRREIIELEQQGASILRIALRGWEQPVSDVDDIAEAGRTHYLLKGGILSLVGATLAELVTHPARWLEGLILAIRLGRRSDKSLMMHLVCLAEASAAARWIRRESASHIHAHFGTNSAEVALQASFLTRIPFSFTVHGPEEFDHPAGLRLREKIQHASFVVAISSFGRSQLYRWADVRDWSKIMVVRCGLDNLFLQAGESQRPVTDTLVCIGRLCEQKGQLLLLEALRQVVGKGHRCNLVLAGDGEMRDQIEARAREFGLTDHVRITGWVDGVRVRKEILAARALVLPSFAEGLPVVLMEALALHRPVISTYVAGIPELVDDTCGWLVPAGDADSLAGAMIRCLQCSDEQLATMGAAGHVRASNLHDQQTEAGKLLARFRGDHSAWRYSRP